MKVLIRIACLWILIPSWGFTQSSTLGTFKKEASGSSGSTSSSSSSGSSTYSSSSSDDDSVADQIVEDLIDATGILLVAGGEQADALSKTRSPWSPTLSMIRAEMGYQSVSDSIDAWDFGLGVGQGKLALAGRTTFYDEEGIEENLYLSTLHAEYRMAVVRAFTFSISMGPSWLSFDSDTDAAFSLALPVHWWPREWVGFEFRPVWSWFDASRVSDYELSAIFNLKGVNLYTGYRWVGTPDGTTDLNGVRIGVGVRF